MTKTIEQYMSKTRGDYGSGVTRPTINQDTYFELKGQFLKELRDNTFSGSEHEDANEHIKKVLEIVDLFHIPKVTQDHIMLRAFLVSITRAARRWLSLARKRVWEPAQLYRDKSSRPSQIDLNAKADFSGIRRIGCGLYAVSLTQHRSILSETIPFPNRLQNFSYDDWRKAQNVKILDAYDHTLPQKEKT
ncbi:hypothetical protein Tco_0978613 [Tanacetum coccineum]|uniref:Uncharacterized protein n=1 Tax=Tanacetum coccineum TaxID=301880 RepID=A0ABQ5ENH2_9ASTR